MLALVNWEVHFIPPQAVHFKDMRLELSGSPVLVTASGEYGFLGNGSYMYINFNDEDFPREDVDCFLMGRVLVNASTRSHASSIPSSLLSAGTDTGGATSVICTDKTGTLTKNQMQVYETAFAGLSDQALLEEIRQVLSKNALLSIQLQTLILQILQRLRQSEIQRKVRCFFGSIKLVLIRLM